MIYLLWLIQKISMSILLIMNLLIKVFLGNFKNLIGMFSETFISIFNLIPNLFLSCMFEGFVLDWKQKKVTKGKLLVSI